MVNSISAQSLVGSGTLDFWEIAKTVGQDISIEMLPDLWEAFRIRKDTAERAELVDLIGLRRSEESTQFLRTVVRGRYRRDTMRRGTLLNGGIGVGFPLGGSP